MRRGKWKGGERISGSSGCAFLTFWKKRFTPERRYRFRLRKKTSARKQITLVFSSFAVRSSSVFLVNTKGESLSSLLSICPLSRDRFGDPRRESYLRCAPLPPLAYARMHLVYWTTGEEFTTFVFTYYRKSTPPLCIWRNSDSRHSRSNVFILWDLALEVTHHWRQKGDKHWLFPSPFLMTYSREQKKRVSLAETQIRRGNRCRWHNFRKKGWQVVATSQTSSHWKLFSPFAKKSKFRM